MIRLTLFAAAVISATQFTSLAQITISYTAEPGQSNVVNSVGTAINGDTVSIGTFIGYDPTAPGNASDLAGLQSHWLNFDSTTTRNIAGVDGRFGATSAAVNNSAFDGKQIYLWITEGSGNNITEYGLYTDQGSPDWVFPAHDSAIPPNVINSNEINTFLFGDGFSSNGGTGTTPGSLQTALVAAVPEPSSLALLGLGLLSWRFFLRRR